mgnify:CR=1 FL=1
MSKLVIIGGGASGMLAAVIAARGGHEVHLFEKNEKLGKKLYITGKGRCNITNACDVDELFPNILSNRKFMYSSIYGFSNHAMMELLTELGLKIKVERGDRVFPESDKSSDVISVLSREMKRLGVNVNLNSKVTEVVYNDGTVAGIKVEQNGKLHQVETENLIIATGGISYASTGSTGDGYGFAKDAGHTVTKLSPGLVPFNTKEEWVKDLQGLALKNVQVTLFCGSKEIYSDFGEMLFTHFGVSGPLILSASSYVKDDMFDKGLTLKIDLKPTLSKEQLDARILREAQENINKDWGNVIEHFLPKKMIPIMLEKIGIPSNKKMNAITKEERKLICDAMKEMDITLVSFRGYSEAIITRGGVTVKEINPATMESKLIKGLYFAGEVLDVDAVTGGFNLQIAWSTAYAAASSVV